MAELSYYTLHSSYTSHILLLSLCVAVSLEDILTDPDDVKDYMMTELGLSEELTMTILEARLTNYAVSNSLSKEVYSLFSL